MDDISYVAAVGASIVFGIIVWWAYGRFLSWGKRASFSIAAVIVGFVVYFVLGILFAVIRPELARQTGMAIGHGVRTLMFMLVVVNAVILTLRGGKSRGRRNEDDA